LQDLAALHAKPATKIFRNVSGIAGITKLYHPVFRRRSHCANADHIGRSNTYQLATLELARQIRVTLSVFFVQEDGDSLSIAMNE
jgi:hypothetical protein